MRRAALLSLACLALLAPAAGAAPATTVERTIQDCDGDDLLEYAFGEEHVEFPDTPFPQPAGPCLDDGLGERVRLPRSASILNFLQLSDFQIVDEESPARVEWLDATQRIPRLQPFSAAHRPQESLTTQVTEAMVRQVRNAVSPVTGQPLELAILTGDNADSQQYNETRWFIDVLDGTTGPENPDPEMQAEPRTDRKIDPNSGIPAPGCEATPGSTYDGVRDSGRSGFAPDGGYYEPDSSSGARDDGDGYSPVPEENEAETPGRRVRVRDFPGLFERANEPFEALGLGIPWYTAFGNHDALVQGNSPEGYAGPFGPGPQSAPDATEIFNPSFHAVATGCLKVMQPAPPQLAQAERLTADIRRLHEGGLTASERRRADELTGELLALATQANAACEERPEAGCSVEVVPPDPRRCFLAKDEGEGAAPGPCTTGGWIEQHFRTSGTPVGHGFAPSPAPPEDGRCGERSTDPACVAASYGRPPQAEANDDGYYSFSPKPGLRFVVLDTITDECGTPFCSEGSLDDTQFEWLRRQIASAEANRQYVITFSHHTLRTIRFPTTDPTEQPVHYGQRFDRRSAGNPQNPGGGETLEELLCGSAAAIAHVAGHEHENWVERHDCADDSPPPPRCLVAAACPNPHFWEVSTAAHIDWPQQARMIELVDLGGELALALTILDHAGPANPGGPRDGDGRGHAPEEVLRLASIARELSYNDYQASREARGGRQDRNVILRTERPPPAAP
jgi:3',5'-cyclic AMP phosphodiesterase CpdA